MKQKEWQRVSSPEDLDRRLVIISSKGWIALTLTALLILGIIIWTFLGTIPNTYDNKVILLQEEGKKNFYAFVPVERGQQMKLGLQVHIHPAGIDIQKYGSIVGEVSEVANTIATTEELKQLLKNPLLVDYLTNNEPVVVIVIHPHEDASGNIKWTSGKQPPFTPKEQTIGLAIFLMHQRAPISYIFPLWK